MTCKACGGKGYVVPEFDLDEMDIIEAEIANGVWDCKYCASSISTNGTCSCAARSPYECCCGGWDDVDLEEWYEN